MRKMTKTAAILAAMSAMTVASASMAFADADQVTNLKALNTPDEATAAGEAAGTWSGSDKDGWKFTTEEGTTLKDTWAEIDGVWYYFDGEKIVQHDLKVIDDKTYFFHEDGSMMANGWYKVTSEMPAYENIEIGEQLEYNEANTYVDYAHAYDYLDYVWLYFDGNGVAMENEWFQDENGYWFYFDGNVTVMNMFNFAIAPSNMDYAESDEFTYYGFDENGCMLTSWNCTDREDVNWNDPTADDNGDIWFYYDTNGGAMYEPGWHKIGENWYLFATQDDSDIATGDAKIAKTTGYPLIVNSYVKSYKNSTTSEAFYVDKKGVMQTGVVEVPKDAWIIDFYLSDNSIATDYENYKNDGKTKKAKVNFGSKGDTTQAKVDSSFYLSPGDSDATNSIIGVDQDLIEDVNGTKYVYDYINAVKVVTGYSSDLKITSTINDSDCFADPTMEAQLVKGAFISIPKKDDNNKIDGDNLFLVDGDGIMVKNRAILVRDGQPFDVTLEKEGANSTGDKTYTEAYLIFGSDGKACKSDKLTVRIGNVSYWATTSKITVGGVEATLYVSSKDNGESVIPADPTPEKLAAALADATAELADAKAELERVIGLNKSAQDRLDQYDADVANSVKVNDAETRARLLVDVEMTNKWVSNAQDAVDAAQDAVDAAQNAFNDFIN